MRTGAEYRNSLRDGRRVWVLGEGRVDDVTTHPATRAMVDEYVAWYDRHVDPAWQDTVLAPGPTARAAIGYLVPQERRRPGRMGRCFSATTFLSAGNITHTPAYGHLIALGVLHAVGLRKASPEQVANAEAYRAEIARTGRFLTFAAGAAPIGYRLREDPAERGRAQDRRQTDAGLGDRGKIGMHTSPAFAEDVYIGAVNGADLDGHRATFVVPVNAPGVTVICRKPAPRDANPFSAPLSSRFDELDGQMWLDDVLVPWDRVFLTEPSPEPVARWLFWHQLYCWLAKAEFTLGLALACDACDGARAARADHRVPARPDHRRADRAELPDRRRARSGDSPPTATARRTTAISRRARIAMLKARRRMGEILRILPGSSLVVAPTDTDLADAGARRGAGGVVRRRRLQRRAARGAAADGLGPCRLGARSARARASSCMPMAASAGLARPAAPQLRPLQRARQRRRCGSSTLPMPDVNLDSIRNAPLAARRPVAPPRPGER